jgi:hypothetical protein
MTRILHAFGIAPMSLAVDLVSSVSSAPRPMRSHARGDDPSMAGTGSSSLSGRGKRSGAAEQLC